jgi:hypothetical protein
MSSKTNQMNIKEQLEDVKDYFTPKIVTEVNDQYVKIRKDFQFGVYLQDSVLTPIAKSYTKPLAPIIDIKGPDR